MPSSKNFKDHFSTSSPGYAAHRPTYPAALVDYLVEMSPRSERALDCGCGTGQLSVLLADRFQEVVATDASSTQIDNAQQHARVTYRVAVAEDSGLPSSSVDLVTVAQAAHWLDLDRFYTEVRRVARPRAAVALITYGVLHVEGPVDAIVQRFYHDVIGPYWPAERRHVEEGYRNLAFPFDEVQAPPLAIEVQWQLDDVVGYVDTWSAIREAEKSLGRAPLDSFRRELEEAWGDAVKRRAVTWPLSLRLGNV